MTIKNLSHVPNESDAACADVGVREFFETRGVEGGGVIGSFDSENAFRHAVETVGAMRLGRLQTFTPKYVEQRNTHSPVAWISLTGGLIGAAGGFAMQAYANVIAYPLDIGGRPKFSWPAFVPIAFELGVLMAVLSAIVAACIFEGLFRFYDPIDESQSLRRAMIDRWIVAAVRVENPQQRARLRVALEELGANEIEEIPP